MYEMFNFLHGLHFKCFCNVLQILDVQSAPQMDAVARWRKEEL